MTPLDAHLLFFLLLGCLIAGAMAYLAATCRGCLLPAILLAIGVLALWAAFFWGAELGYRAWQNQPDPPREAFEDTSVVGALFLGWLPAALYCASVFVATRVIRWLMRRLRADDRAGDVRRPTPRVETGNPYQGPDS